MKIALASQMNEENIQINLQLIEKSMIRLKNQVDLVSFGEAFLHGFDALSWDYLRDKEIAISLESKYIKKLQLVAKTNNIAVSFGFYELENERIYCTYLMIDKKGKIINLYRRVSPGWKDCRKCDYHYQEGKNFSTFNYMNKQILIAVCGDLWYEENIKLINKFDKDFILWPLHIDYKIEHWENEIDDYLLQTRKLKVPVLMINNISDTSYGGCYLFKNGKIIERLKMGEKGFLIINI